MVAGEKRRKGEDEDEHEHEDDDDEDDCLGLTPYSSNQIVNAPATSINGVTTTPTLK
jgi:hypothetical protein